MKNVIITVVLFTSLIYVAAGQSVFVGRAGAEGKVLNKYIDPTALKKLVDNPVDSIWIFMILPKIRTDS
jgi:hypothetical protein